MDREDFTPLDADLERLLAFALPQALDYRRSVGQADASPTQTFAEMATRLDDADRACDAILAAWRAVQTTQRRSPRISNGVHA